MAGVLLHQEPAYGIVRAHRYCILAEDLMFPYVPAGGGKEQLVQQLLQRYPHRFALPRRLTDKKPGKADKDVSTDTEYVKPDVLTKLAAQGQLVWSQPDTATSVTLAITQDAMLEVAAAGVTI